MNNNKKPNKNNINFEILLKKSQMKFPNLKI